MKDFGGGVQGDFSGLEKLLEGLKGGHYVDIGILGDSNETVEGGITLAGIGAVQEFGSLDEHTPERSFIRMPLETGQEDIEKAVEPKMEGLLASGDIEGIYKLIGVAGEGRILEAFETKGFGSWAPNAPSTVTRKGSDSPLIDKGDLKKAIMSKVGK